MKTPSIAYQTYFLSEHVCIHQISCQHATHPLAKRLKAQSAWGASDLIQNGYRLAWQANTNLPLSTADMTMATALNMLEIIYPHRDRDHSSSTMLVVCHALHKSVHHVLALDYHSFGVYSLFHQFGMYLNIQPNHSRIPTFHSL